MSGVEGPSSHLILKAKRNMRAHGPGFFGFHKEGFSLKHSWLFIPHLFLSMEMEWFPGGKSGHRGPVPPWPYLRSCLITRGPCSTPLCWGLTQDGLAFPGLSCSRKVRGVILRVQLRTKSFWPSDPQSFHQLNLPHNEGDILVSCCHSFSVGSELRRVPQFGRLEAFD